MDRRSIAKLLTITLLCSLLSVGSFSGRVNADSKEKDLKKIYNAFEDSVNEYYRTHKVDKDGCYTFPDKDYKDKKKDDKNVKSYATNTPEETKYIAPYSKVKNQGRFGTCWMFSCMSAVESSLLLKDYPQETGLIEEDPIDLSEAQGTYCNFNPEKDENEEPLSYSSNDHRTLLSGNDHLGFSGGSPNLDGLMVLSADKGSVLENENPYLLSDFSQEYESKSADQQEAEKQSIMWKDANDMASSAISQYRKNRLNIKSACWLPNYSASQYVNPTRELWKEKIRENGALSVSYYHCTGGNQTDEFDETTAYNEESGNTETTTNNTNIETTSDNSNLETTTGDTNTETTSLDPTTEPVTKNPKHRYFHCWGKDESVYKSKSHLPNYWYFDKTYQGVNHGVAIVGYDDQYSRYNFAEKYIKSEMDYDSNIAEIMYVKEDEAGNPQLPLNKDGHYVGSADLVSREPKEGYGPYVTPRFNGCWFVKNNWGDKNKNGKLCFDNGIMYVSYCERSISNAITFDIEENINQIKEGKKVYDTTLTHSSIKGTMIDSLPKDTKSAEIFTAEKDMQIKQIGYWTGTDCITTTTTLKIYKGISNPNEINDNNPDYETVVDDDYLGYHTVTIPSEDYITVSEGEKVCVIASQESKNKCALMMEGEKDEFYTVMCANNESYISYDGNWYDIKEVDDEADENNTGISVGNSTVKLFGSACNNKYDLKDFKYDKASEEYTYPEKEGCIFAGWYEDKGLTIPCEENKKDGIAYAKFIDESVLKPMAQGKGDDTAIRFVSSIDHLDYKDVGFIISGSYGDDVISERSKSVSKVYTKINANGGVVLPSYFCESSKYMFTYTVRGMDGITLSKWKVTPYYITPDGTKVIGTTKRYHLPQ